MLSSDTHIDDFELPWMTLNGVIVLILRFFSTEFQSFAGKLRHMVEGRLTLS